VKIIDYIIIASLMGGMFLGYSGFRIEAALLLAVVIIVASWRFWDRSREKQIMRRGSSGHDGPDHPDSTSSSGGSSSDGSADSCVGGNGD